MLEYFLWVMDPPFNNQVVENFPTEQLCEEARIKRTSLDNKDYMCLGGTADLLAGGK